jgi:hypothetical protein
MRGAGPCRGRAHPSASASAPTHSGPSMNQAYPAAAPSPFTAPAPVPPAAAAAPRWAKFAGVSVPWLTKLANAFISGQLEARQAELARDAVDNLEKLGPTFLKLAQILSIRWGRGPGLGPGAGAAARDWGPRLGTGGRG